MEGKPHVCFEVEKIIGVSNDGNYHVQWAPSWVNKFHLVGCEHLIRQFLQQQQTEVDIAYSCQPQVDVTDLNTVNSHRPESNPADLDIPYYQPEFNQSGRVDHDAIPELKASGYKNEMIRQDNVESLSIAGRPLTSVSESTAGVRSDQEPVILTTTNELLGDVVVKVEESETIVPNLEVNPVYMETVVPDIGISNVSMETVVPDLGVNNTVSMVCSNRYSKFSDVKYCSGTSDQGDLHEMIIHQERTPIHSNGLSPHRHTIPRKKHVCHVCDRAFGRTCHLRDHIMTHTGVRPFSCEYCKQEFIQKTNLKKHIQRCPFRGHSTKTQLLLSPLIQEDAASCDSVLTPHVNDDPKKKYKCHLCERRFRSSGNLKDHVRTHTGIKPFSCEFCEERFIQKSNLKKHVRCYHPEPLNVEQPAASQEQIESNELPYLQGDASMVTGPS